MKIYWDNRLGKTGVYNLRAHPAAMILKLTKMSGGTWVANCLGEAGTFPNTMTDTEVKAAAISWMLPILDRLRGALHATIQSK